MSRNFSTISTDPSLVVVKSLNVAIGGTEHWAAAHEAGSITEKFAAAGRRASSLNSQLYQQLDVEELFQP